MSDPILLQREGAVATLTFNRPEALNTLDFAMVEALVARTAEVAADDTLRVVVLRGAGKHFMAGGDIRTFAGELRHPPAERQAGFQRMVERVHAAVETLHRMAHPVVGCVHGAVAGIGFSFMNACDLVVAADNAYFTSAYRHIALTPDGGGSWTLPRIVGMRKAMEILLLSERFDAAEALRLGLVNKVVALDRLDTEVNALERRRCWPSATRGAWFAIRLRIRFRNSSRRKPSASANARRLPTSPKGSPRSSTNAPLASARIESRHGGARG